MSDICESSGAGTGSAEAGEGPPTRPNGGRGPSARAKVATIYLFMYLLTALRFVSCETEFVAAWLAQRPSADPPKFGGTQTGSYQTGSYQKGRFIPP